ncbi:Fur family transcriptional regulator [Pontibaca methylaminivorans]|uniref:Fur family transcriptional regulator n=1 Tax=Pontibaca methylaminivorans TaxID=515897 RepID=UPI002FD897C5
MGTIGFHCQDHANCVGELIAHAETLCRENNLRFTPGRRRVLEILAEEHQVFGAYDILERLSREGLGSQPPVVYRALDFLQQHGLVHRIERRSAYVACAFPGVPHVPAFLICRSCDMVAEAPSAPMRGTLGDAAREIGFAVEETVIEATGLCPACRAGTAGNEAHA